jgi:hypothetical protein
MKFILMMFLGITCSLAAFTSDLIPDRPGFYNNPQIIDPGSLIVEIGVQSALFDDQNELNVYTIEPSLNTIKYGIGEKVELRFGIGWGVLLGDNRSTILASAQENDEDIYQNISQLGAKINLFESSNQILSTELNLGLPAFLGNDFIDPVQNISLLHTSKLDSEWALSSNLRFSFIDLRFESRHQTDFHIAVEHSPFSDFGWLLESWSSFALNQAEFFSNAPEPILVATKETWDIFTGINLAVWYRPTERIQVDLQAARRFDLSKFEVTNSEHIFFNAGASFLIR